jgi:hypothetical protein
MAHDDEAARYREAAHCILDQLAWCVEYLRSIRKTEIAERIDKNRSAIARSMPAPGARPRKRATRAADSRRTHHRGSQR